MNPSVSTMAASIISAGLQAVSPSRRQMSTDHLIGRRQMSNFRLSAHLYALHSLTENNTARHSVRVGIYRQQAPLAA